MTKLFFAIEFDGDRNMTLAMTSALNILLRVKLHIKLTWPLLLGAQTCLSAAFFSLFMRWERRHPCLLLSFRSSHSLQTRCLRSQLLRSQLSSELIRANAAARRRLLPRE